MGQVWFTGQRVRLVGERRFRLPREERMRGYQQVQLRHCDERSWPTTGRSCRSRSNCGATPGRPVLGGERLSGFLAANPAALLIDVGRREPAGLRETWLTARTHDVAAMRRWREFAATILAATQPTDRPDARRCSPAAAALAAQGVALLPVAGPATDPTTRPVPAAGGRPGSGVLFDAVGNRTAGPAAGEAIVGRYRPAGCGSA